MDRRVQALFACGLVLLLAARATAAETPSWRIERGEVQILVPLRPGGAFTAKTPSLGGTLALGPERPVRLGGEISIDLATIDTGIALRNQHLREKYLEVGKGQGFDKAILSEIRLNDAEGEAFEGRTRFGGTLLLHGVKRPVAGTAEIRSEGPGRSVRAEFPLELTEFGVTPPEYLGVGVASKLLVKVQFTAASARAPAK
jgi:polyisoprenoid-binding protein YceI